MCNYSTLCILDVMRGESGLFISCLYDCRVDVAYHVVVEISWFGGNHNTNILDTQPVLRERRTNQ